MTTDIQIVNEFTVDADDYHEFHEIVSTLSKTLGLVYTYKEIPSDQNSKAYKATFTLKALRSPAQYSGR